MRKALLCQRFIDRDDWRENRLRLGLAGVKFEAVEPDWFNLSYGIEIDPNLPLEERMRLWNERIKPEFERLEREGKFRRLVAEGAE